MVYSGTTLAAWSRTFYDGLGRAVQTQTPFVEANGAQSDLVQFTTFDALGRVLTQSTPYTVTAYTYMTTSGVVNTPYVPNDLTRPASTLSYDALGRMTFITAPDGTRTFMAYAADTTPYGSYTPTLLFVKGTVDANNHGRHDVTDAFGRLVRVREFTGTYGVSGYTAYAETQYAYDALDNLRVVTDALGNRTVITYDALGRKTSMNDPDMGVWSYAYDANSNLFTQTDASRQTITFTYDALNRMTAKKFGASVLASYGYDSGTFGLGRRITASVAGLVTDTVGYDARGRAVTQTRRLDGLTYTTTLRYDAADRVTGMTLPTGEVITHTYNAASQLTATKGLSTYVQSAVYNVLGNMSRLNFGNTANAQQRYWGLDYVGTPANKNFGRLRGICVSTLAGTCSDVDASVWMNLAYDFDAVGNITALMDRTRNETTTFGYDSLDRLVSASSPVNEGYVFDKVGNITFKTGAGNYVYGIKPHAVLTATGGTQNYFLSYDANGNMTKRVEGSTTFTQGFNVENRLTAMTRTGNVTLTQLYDADGVRVKKRDGYTTTIYIGSSIEIAISGTNRVTTTYYFFGSSRVATRQGVVVTWLHGDHLGSASLATNYLGGKVAGSDARYTPFGEYRSGLAGGASPTDNRFTGQKRLSGWNLDDFVARGYSASLGRFVSADAIVPNPTGPQNLNRYSYALGNPLKLTDPSGHCSGSEADTKNPDAACWNMLRQIEKDFDNVSIQADAYDLGKLTTILRGLRIMRNYFGSQRAFYVATGNIVILDPNSRRFTTLNSQCTSNGGCTVHGAVEAISLRNFNEATVVHELAHAYDFNMGFHADRRFRDMPGNAATQYGQDNGPREDFAETVTWAALHDARGAGLVTGFPSNYGYGDPSKERIDNVYGVKLYARQLAGLVVSPTQSPVPTPLTSPTSRPTPASPPSRRVGGPI